MKEFVARRSRAQREPSTLNWVNPSRDLIFLFNSQNTAALIQQRLGSSCHRLVFRLCPSSEMGDSSGVNPLGETRN
jgi:hypothetical protein